MGHGVEVDSEERGALLSVAATSKGEIARKADIIG